MPASNVAKVRVEDNAAEGYRIITNNGLVSAVNSVYGSGIPDPPRTESISSIVNGANDGGSLGATNMANGESYFGLDPVTGFIAIAAFAAGDGAGTPALKGIKIGAV